MKIFVLISLLAALACAAPSKKQNHITRGLVEIKDKVLAAAHKSQTQLVSKHGINEADHVRRHNENEADHVGRRDENGKRQMTDELPAHCVEFVAAGLDLIDYAKDTGFLATMIAELSPGRPGGPGGPGGPQGHGPGGLPIPDIEQIRAIVNNPAILRQALCAVASVMSLEELSEVTGIDYGLVARYYTLGMIYIETKFRYSDEMLDLWHMYNDMAEFMNKFEWTGPTQIAPVPHEESIEFAQYIIDRYGEYGPSHLAVVASYVLSGESAGDADWATPFAVVPEDFARALNEATDFMEFADIIGTDVMQVSFLMSALSQVRMPGFVMGLPDLDLLVLSQKALAFADAANYVGLFNLE